MFLEILYICSIGIVLGILLLLLIVCLERIIWGAMTWGSENDE